VRAEAPPQGFGGQLDAGHRRQVRIGAGHRHIVRVQDAPGGHVRGACRRAFDAAGLFRVASEVGFAQARDLRQRRGLTGGQASFWLRRELSRR